MTWPDFILFIKFLIWSGLNNMKLYYRLWCGLLFFNFLQATHLYLIKKESYWQTPQKTKQKKNDEHKKRNNISTSVSWVHSLMLKTYIHRLAIFIFRAFRPKVVVWVEFSMVHSIFPVGKHDFPNSLINSKHFRKLNI